jgi:hypothetical protein
MNWAVAFWIAALILVYASTGLAILATRARRHWLVAPGAVLVLTAILLAIIGLPPAPDPLLHLTVGLGFLLLGVVGGSPAVSLVLSLATSDSVKLGDHGGILVDGEKATSRAASTTREVLRGGATIGFVERLALIGAVLVGQSAAVAIIVAVKGLGRFSELENASARERFIIGTLVSLVWAAAFATAIMLAR